MNYRPKPGALQPSVPSLADGNPLSFPASTRLTPEREGMAAEYVRILKRHRWHILVCAFGGLLLCVLIGLRSIPIYTTRTSLEIRSVNNDFMDMRTVAPTG